MSFLGEYGSLKIYIDNFLEEKKVTEFIFERTEDSKLKPANNFPRSLEMYMTRILSISVKFLGMLKEDRLLIADMSKRYYWDFDKEPDYTVVHSYTEGSIPIIVDKQLVIVSKKEIRIWKDFEGKKLAEPH